MESQIKKTIENENLYISLSENPRKLRETLDYLQMMLIRRGTIVSFGTKVDNIAKLQSVEHLNEQIKQLLGL